MLNFTKSGEPLWKCNHFFRRQLERRVSDEDVAMALQYDKRFYEGEDRVYFLGRRQISPGLPARVAGRLNGTTVVVGPGGRLVTVWRNPKSHRTLKRRDR